MERELKDICKAIREKTGLSQRELAFIIESNQTEVSFIERGFIPTNERKITALKKLYETVIEVKKNENNTRN